MPLLDALPFVPTGPWALAAMSAFVLADAFLVVVPGEIAVTAVGAVATATGSPQLWAVIVCAAVAAACGDLACYGIGRAIGISRWRWMRGRRVAAALAWAGARLDRNLATTLFTARFIPFARLATNLSAGASRVAAPRFAVLISVAASGWACYQALIGAAVVRLMPDDLPLAILISVFVALALGLAVDTAVSVLRRLRSRD